MERRLAAILAADVVGYSRLMEADEEATARTLSTYREIIERLVASHMAGCSVAPATASSPSSPARSRPCAVQSIFSANLKRTMSIYLKTGACAIA